MFYVLRFTIYDLHNLYYRHTLEILETLWIRDNDRKKHCCAVRNPHAVGDATRCGAKRRRFHLDTKEIVTVGEATRLAGPAGLLCAPCAPRSYLERLFEQEALISFSDSRFQIFRFHSHAFYTSPLFPFSKSLPTFIFHDAIPFRFPFPISDLRFHTS